MIINAENKVMGRVAAFAAKKAMIGEKVDIVNCEKSIITGHKKRVLKDYERKMHMGVPKKGPFVLRQPDRFFRRRVRGMLPYKTPRGIEAFSRVMCHVGIPEEFAKEKQVEVHNADLNKLTNLKFTTVGVICSELGGKVAVEKPVATLVKEEPKKETPKEQPKEEKPAEKIEEKKDEAKEETPSEASDEKKEEVKEDAPKEEPKEDKEEEAPKKE